MNKQQQKILLLVTRGTVGGAQTSVINLARVLRVRGVDVVVGFGDGQFLERECLGAGIPFRRFSNLRRTLNPITNISFLWKIKKMLDSEGYDVIHINSSNALFAALGARLSKNRVKTVFTFRGLSVLDEGYKSRWVRFLYRVIFRFLMMFVDEPVFVSQANYESAKESKLVKRGAVIHNGLDSKRLVFFDPENARTDLADLLERDLSGRFLVGSIGRLAYQKNYEFLITQTAELAKERPELLVVIIGSGPKREELTRMIDEHRLWDHVLLVGEIPNASRYILAFDLFVLPSRYEGLSITLIETLFAGVPVLASDVGGAREQFSHAPFQVYPLNDGDAFQEKMTRLIDNPSIREELAEANKQRSIDFTIYRVTREYLEVYQGK